MPQMVAPVHAAPPPPPPPPAPIVPAPLEPAHAAPSLSPVTIIFPPPLHHTVKIPVAGGRIQGLGRLNTCQKFYLICGNHSRELETFLQTLSSIRKPDFGSI